MARRNITGPLMTTKAALGSNSGGQTRGKTGPEPYAVGGLMVIPILAEPKSLHVV